jgi:hypothetical protein
MIVKMKPADVPLRENSDLSSFSTLPAELAGGQPV